MKLVFLGPPGVGKGTQAAMLAQADGLPHISTGEMIRDAIKQETDIGRKAKSYVESGGLVPDDIVIAIVGERIAQPDCVRGFLLDGFPRTLEQAEALDRILAEKDGRLDAALYFKAGDEELISRLAGRRICRNCDANYHVKNLPPKREGICDKCGGPLYQREDDKPETVRRRLQVYRAETAGLIDYYRKRGILHEIDAERSVGEVQQTLRRAIAGLKRGG